MTQSNTLRNILLKEIEKIPEGDIQEILDFTEFLTQKRKKLQKEKSDKTVDAQTQWQKFIGGVEHGNLAQDIDKELYG